MSCEPGLTVIASPRPHSKGIASPRPHSKGIASPRPHSKGIASPRRKTFFEVTLYLRGNSSTL